MRVKIIRCLRGRPRAGSDISVEGFDAFGHGRYLWLYDTSLRYTNLPARTVNNIIAKELQTIGNTNAMRHLRTLLLAGGLAFTALLIGCDMGTGPMMGRQTLPSSFKDNGERIYFTGISASGNPVTFSGGHMHVRMHGGSCASCHGADRQGGTRMMPWFWVVAPAITAEALFGNHEEADGHGDHQAYTETSLRRAIIEGIDPSGKPLDNAMPRWSMSKQDLDDLLQYLQGDHEHDDTH